MQCTNVSIMQISIKTQKRVFYRVKENDDKKLEPTCNVKMAQSAYNTNKQPVGSANE